MASPAFKKAPSPTSPSKSHPAWFPWSPKLAPLAGLDKNSATAAGTGVTVPADGYILTNKHVVDGAEEINIITDDGTTYTKVTLRTDPINDIAFLKSKMLTVYLPPSSVTVKPLMLGQQVIAIGNARSIPKHRLIGHYLRHRSLRHRHQSIRHQSRKSHRHDSNRHRHQCR